MNEYEKQHLVETISAYLDGESDAPEKVARLIETDPEAARLFSELSRLSTGLKALPVPEVHPAFATRVMAHVREDRQAAGTATSRRWVWMNVFGALAAGVVAVLAVWPFLPDKGFTAPTKSDPVIAEVLRLRNQPDQELNAQFGPLISEPEGTWAMAAETEGDIALVVHPAISDDAAEVAGKVATLLSDENGYDEDADVFASLDSLSESQTEALRALLSDDADRGNDLL
jgi:hypothetical protein